MASQKDWPFPASVKSLRWRVCQASLIGLVHTVSRLYIRLFQQVQSKNLGLLRNTVLNRPKGTPLVTISNHSSCIDDPVLWGLMPLRGIFKDSALRWIPAAREYIYINKLANILASRVRLVPVIRGDGVYQRAMNFCIDKLNEGDWVHVFPEGKITLNGDNARMKWGVSRLIAEAKATPIVIPFWHIGMHNILPTRSPYIPQLFQRLTVFIGEPLDFSSWLDAHRTAQTSAVVIRRQLTEKLQYIMADLKLQAEVLHKDWNTKWPVSYRML